MLRKTLTFSSQGQPLLDQAAQIAEWSSFKLSANQLRAIGELRLRELDKGGQLEGGLSLRPLSTCASSSPAWASNYRR